MEDKKLSPLDKKAEKILNQFSQENLKFVLPVLKGISNAIEFAPKNSVASYTLQSSSRNPLVQERQLLRKFHSLGLFRLGRYGDVSDVVPIWGANKKLIKECIKRGNRWLAMAEVKRRTAVAETKKKLSQTEPAVSETGGNRRFCRFENDTFFITLNDGSEKAMNFGDKRGTKNMLDLFDVLFDYWKEFGVLVDGWVRAVVPKAEIRKRLGEKGRANTSDSWIKDTINNIRQFKINPSGLKGYVAIDYYERKSAGYPFRIKKI